MTDDVIIESRESDAVIAKLVRPGTVVEQNQYGEWYWNYVHEDDGREWENDLPAFTTSLEAITGAIALALPDFWWIAGTGENGKLAEAHIGKDGDSHGAAATTPQLALCVALQATLEARR